MTASMTPVPVVYNNRVKEVTMTSVLASYAYCSKGVDHDQYHILPF
jgi:hypothetical protein